MTELSRSDIDRLRDFISQAEEVGSTFPGMTYEDGMGVILDVLEGGCTVSEAINE
jgi:hypothetical protein